MPVFDEPASFDVLVVGAGIAGMWLAVTLDELGYRVLLVESKAFGAGQTRYAQGIIHGGMKFSLDGKLSAAARAVRDMPERWRAHLAGRRAPNLGAVQVLSPAHYLVADGSALGALARRMAGALVHSPSQVQHAGAQAPALAGLGVTGPVLALDEPVVDVPSLIAVLAERCRRLSVHARAVPLAGQSHLRLELHAGGIFEVSASAQIWTAGAGNGAVANETQVRPLHMVMAKGLGLPPVYAHVVGAGQRPRVTITTHALGEERLWYLGGDLAERGVTRDAAAQIAAAGALLRRVLPEFDPAAVQWATVFAARHEPATSARARPDDVVTVASGGCMTAWPVKLALAPKLADRALAWLQERGVTPRAAPVTDRPGPPPPVAPAIWEEAGAWT